MRTLELIVFLAPLLIFPLQLITPLHVDPEVEKTSLENIKEMEAEIPNYLSYFPEIEKYAGKNIEVQGKVDKDSFYFKFLFAYHIGYPANGQQWSTAFSERKLNVLPYYKHVRKCQAQWEDILRFKSTCESALATQKSLLNPDRQVDHELRVCEKGNLLKSVKSGKFSEDVIKARVGAVYLIGRAIDFCLGLNFHGMDEYSGRGYEAPTVHMAPFYRMAEEANDDHYEIKRRLVELQSKIDGMQDGDQKKNLDRQLKEVQTELKAPPYDEIYADGSRNIANTRYNYATYLYNGFNDDEFLNLSVYFVYEDAPGWFTTKTAEFDETYFNDAIDALDLFFFEYLDVTPDENGTGGWKWEWDLASDPVPVKNYAHFIRESWELLDKMHERLKCLMKETYYFDLREKALQNTQFSLETETLYSSISHTLFRPCRITNDTDLVTKDCTKENHEICRPMHYESSLLQNPEHDTQGGISLLRPKYYYEMNSETGECGKEEEFKTYIIPYKACQCGFRLDCGKDFGPGKDIVCQLQADYVRRQCRGTVGYPCQSMPLAPGRHHESCLSGYCDLEENTCEDAPVWIDPEAVNGGNRVVVGGIKTSGVVLICILLGGTIFE